jgi:hypothetical protein
MAWCENMMPIGAYYLRALPDRGPAIYTVPTGPIAVSAVQFTPSSPPQLAFEGNSIGWIGVVQPSYDTGNWTDAGTNQVLVGPISTISANDVLLMFVLTETPNKYGSSCLTVGPAAPPVTGISGAGLNWTLQFATDMLSTVATFGFHCGGSNARFELWTAIAPTPLVSAHFTVTLAANPRSSSAGVFAVGGENFADPFDDVNLTADFTTGEYPGPLPNSVVVNQIISPSQANVLLWGVFATVGDGLGYAVPNPLPPPIAVANWHNIISSTPFSPGDSWVSAQITGPLGNNIGPANLMIALYAIPTQPPINYNLVLSNFPVGPGGATLPFFTSQAWFGIAGAIKGYNPSLSATELTGNLSTLPAIADTLLIAGWIGNASGLADLLIDTANEGISLTVNITSITTSIWSFTAKQGNGAVIVSGMTTVTGPNFESGWHSFAVSARMSTQTIQVLVDSTHLSTTGFTFSSNNPVGYSAMDLWQVGPFAHIGDLAALWFDAGLTFFDLTVAGNVQTLFGMTNCFANWGANGQNITGSQPQLLLSGDATAFANNLGTGGAFSASGQPLLTATTKPPVC